MPTETNQLSEKVSRKQNFYTFQSLLDAGIITPCPDMTTAKDYMQYLSDPNKYDSISYIPPPTQGFLQSKVKYEAARAQYEKENVIYTESAKIKQSSKKIKEWGGFGMDMRSGIYI